MPRIEPLQGGSESNEVQKVFSSIHARGSEPSPLYRTLAHAPALLAVWAGFASALRTDTSVERAVSELVIMRLAQLSEADYQWAYHWKPALVAGVTESQLHALAGWRMTSAFDARQRAALAYSESMFANAVTDADMSRLKGEFSTHEIVELTLTIGFYINVGRVLQALSIDVDPSRRPLLP